MSLSQAIAQWVPGLGQRAVQFDPKLLEALRSGGAMQSAAGMPVTIEGSLRNTVVLTCVLMIAESLASVPLVLYKTRPGGGRTPQPDHPLYGVLHDLTNPLMTSMDVRAMMLAHCLLYGNAYAEIDWDADGYPVGLWPLDPQRVGIEMTPDRQLVYTYWSDRFGGVTLPAWRVHHQRGLAMRGVLGLSPIRAAMNAVGLGLATEEFGSLYFANGSRPSIVLSHPAKLTPEQLKNLRASFEMQWSGLDNAHRIAVVGEGVKPEAMGIPPEEAQFLETRQFQVREIARVFKMPPFLLGDTQTTTYASAEQEMLRFRELTLGPWAERIEKAIYRDLLTADEQRTMFVAHKLSKLQATDLKTRYDTFSIGKNAGILTTNEVREMEDLNPVAGGDMLWMPLNMAPADQVAAGLGAATGTGQRTENKESRAEGDEWLDEDHVRVSLEAIVRMALHPLIDDVRQRVTNRVTNDFRLAGAKALRRGGRAGLEIWIGETFPDWRQAANDMLGPLETVARRLAVTSDATDVGQWIDEAMRSAIATLLAKGENDGRED